MGNIEYPDGEENSDGSEEQLALFAGGPELCGRFAREYFEQTIPLEPVNQIYRHEVLTETTIKQLNPQAISALSGSRDAATPNIPVPPRW